MEVGVGDVPGVFRFLYFKRRTFGSCHFHSHGVKVSFRVQQVLLGIFFCSR